MATTADLEARIAELEQRIRQLQSERDEQYGIAPLLRKMFPPDVRKHMRAANREQLLALRSMLDHWIAQQEEESATPRRESIRVE